MYSVTFVLLFTAIFQKTLEFKIKLLQKFTKFEIYVLNYFPSSQLNPSWNPTPVLPTFLNTVWK